MDNGWKPSIFSNETFQIDIEDHVAPPPLTEKSSLDDSAIIYIHGPQKWAIGLVYAQLFLRLDT